MKKHLGETQAITLLKSAVGTIVRHKEVFFPFCFIGFTQLFILEILYFAPRYPLNTFFAPVITKFYGEQFLHYPNNFIILPRLFHNIYLQCFIYIFISSFFIAVAIAMIADINQGKKIEYKQIFKNTISSSVHIFSAAAITFAFLMVMSKFQFMLQERALQIRSVSGIFYLIKVVFVNGAPYINLLLNIIATTIFAYMLPVIVIGKKKVTVALIENFRLLGKSLMITFLLVLLPSLFLLPVILLRSIFTLNSFLPELTAVNLVITIIVMLAIDATVYISITCYYLVRQESQ